MAANPAVSVRNMRFPRRMAVYPQCAMDSSSAGEKPPSGPMISVMESLLAGLVIFFLCSYPSILQHQERQIHRYPVDFLFS